MERGMLAFPGAEGNANGLTRQVEQQWNWVPFAEAVTGLPSVNRDAAMRLRG